MGWLEESGRHEGHVKVVYADGRLGGGMSSAAGWSVDGPDGLAARGVDGEEELRPPAAVVGWRIACDHVPRFVSDEDLGRRFHQPERWLSPVVWHRVYSPAEQDIGQHRIFASLDDPCSVDLMDRAEGDEQLEELLLAEWRAHIEPEDHARSIRAALDGVTAAKELLDMEVSAAHAGGMSWAEIGRVAGMTRQAARDRWGTS